MVFQAAVTGDVQLAYRMKPCAIPALGAVVASESLSSSEWSSRGSCGKHLCRRTPQPKLTIGGVFAVNYVQMSVSGIHQGDEWVLSVFA